jgi:hypothetical protein
MAYDGGGVACTDHDLVIRHYYVLGRAKRIPYDKIREVRQVSLNYLGRWRVKTYGSGDGVHWFNFDKRRSDKDKGLAFLLAGRVMPVITPDDAGRVAEELAAHGVRVRMGNW